MAAAWSADECRLPLILSNREKEDFSSTASACSRQDICHVLWFFLFTFVHGPATGIIPNALVISYMQQAERAGS